MGYIQPRRVLKTDEFRDWIDGLKDVRTRARILVRVDRLIHGHPGDHRHLSKGVSELKIAVGPGYRVYYAQRGPLLLILLAGGDKSGQVDDIARSLRLAAQWQE
jgi:putative addiction module killer protein